MKPFASIIIVFLIFIMSGCWLSHILSKDYSDELLNYLVTQDKDVLREALNSAAACKTTKKLLNDDMAFSPVYTRDEQDTCVSADLEGELQQEYFSDQDCSQPVSFMPADYGEFCSEIIASRGPNTVLGNAAVWQPNDAPIGNAPTRKWTPSYGAMMKFTLGSLDNNTVPFMKRVNYKTIENVQNSDGSTRGNGTCKLEMRIYKKDISTTNLQPLLAIHGGSWKLRTAGFPGLESSVSHYTEQGFIVFSPFYRLIGDREANVECNNASWQDVVSDVEDALKWVWNNGEAVGAAPGRPVALTGQSAGAHLSTWLLVHGERHHVPISRALLLYPPTDFKDFISHAVAGDRYEAYTTGLSTFETFFGTDDINSVDSEQLEANSFPALVRQNVNVPPVFIIHGVADKIVPSMQSVRLCNAYNRSGPDLGSGVAVDDGGDPVNGVYMRQYDCGAVGKLHLFAEADHALDLKCVEHVLCPAGSPATVPVLEASLSAGRQWLMGN